MLYNQLPMGISGFPCGSAVKNPPATRETWVRSLGWEDPLEKGKATHSSILVWRIPWTVYGVTKSRTRLSNFHFHISEAMGINHLHGLYLISGKKMIRTLAGSGCSVESLEWNDFQEELGFIPAVLRSGSDRCYYYN